MTLSERMGACARIFARRARVASRRAHPYQHDIWEFAGAYGWREAAGRAYRVMYRGYP